jgi:riboflavin biosynthesis pyrimidine reductase
VFASDGVRRIVNQAVDRERPDGVEIIRLEATEGKFDPREILHELREAGLETLLIEGGGFTLSTFIEVGLLTRLHVAIAPLLIGAGLVGLTLPEGSDKLADALRPDTRSFALGAEVVFDCEPNDEAAQALTPVHHRASSGRYDG